MNQQTYELYMTILGQPAASQPGLDQKNYKATSRTHELEVMCFPHTVWKHMRNRHRNQAGGKAALLL